MVMKVGLLSTYLHMRLLLEERQKQGCRSDFAAVTYRRRHMRAFRNLLQRS